jgi:tetratricopeptide (TPR) repeat protein
MKKVIPVHCLLMTAIIVPAVAHAQGLQVRQISDKILIAAAADSGECQLVIKSEKGLVAIDTFWSEITAWKYKKEIAKALHRDDFAYALNLVDRLDMFGGNAAYKEAKIIGHDSFLGKYKGKEKEVEAEIGQLIEMWREKAEISRKRLEVHEKGSEKAIKEERWMKTCMQRAEELEKGFSLLLPELFFNDRMTLDLGDITLKLIWFGKAGNHNGMTVVVIPEEKLAIIPGFILHSQHLAPYPYGGYAKLDVPRWIAVLEEILEGENAVERVFCDLGDIWTRERARQHLEYIRGLWNSVKTAEAAGKDLHEIQEQLSLDREFAFVKKMPVYQEHGDQWVRPQHWSHVRVFFLQHKKLASELLANIGPEKIDDAISRIRKLREKGSGTYFDEVSFIGIGYSLMNAGKFPEAAKVFKFSVELFPKSANAYDSLGEAYMKAGNKRLAIENYKKSLELNPENGNAKKMLEQLQEK